MSYRDPYADPYYGGANQYPSNHTGPGYGQNQYLDDNFGYNPYTQPSHPTYEGGYGTHQESGYTDEPTYPPQRRPTHQSQHDEPETLHHKKESYQLGAGFADMPPKKRTASALRQYRYDHQGALWTKGGRGRCIGRFCCCTVMTVLFLIVSIVLALALWVRPPGIVVGDVRPVSQGGSQITTQVDGDGASLTIHLALNITVNNPNYFSVNFKQVKAELFYPINNVPIGGGTSNNVVFPSNTQTNWTFPFDVQYKPSNDPGNKVLGDLVSKCVANKQNLDINYKITLGLRILVITIFPTITNTFSFPCPIDSSTIQQMGGGAIPPGLLGN